MSKSSHSPLNLGRRDWLQRLGVQVGALALGSTLGGSLSGCGGGSDAGDSATTTSDPGLAWPSGMSANFEHAAATGLVLPQAIQASSGQVSAAAALLDGGACTLVADADTPPTVMLDYGRVTGGVPTLEVVAFTGAPVLHFAHSESAAYRDGGDVTLGFSIASEPSRAVTWPVTATGVLRGRVLQGGQRWQKVWLTGSGSVTVRQLGLDAVTIHSVADRSATGWFRSSDALLNQIWSIGAYTAELNQMAQGTQPTPWVLGTDGANVGPSGLALYQAGVAWSTYTVQFHATVQAGGLGWAVRASMLTRLAFTLCTADDADHPDTLSIETGSIFIGGTRTLSRVSLPTSLPTGQSAVIATEVTASGVNVSIDGAAVTTVSLAEVGFLPNGSFGFFNRSACAAVVSDVSVVDAQGASLYASGLRLADQASVLRAFPVGSNPVPLLTDGAKRERQSFSLDLVAAAPAVYCGTGWSECVAGSLRQLCAYIDANGQIASTLDPAMSLDPLSPATAPQSRWYSLSYALHVVVALADCWRHSGDLSLVQDLWPAVSGQLSWAHSLVDSTGLLLTDGSTGLDWHPQFGGALSGHVSLVNVVYVKALRDAAEMATALGQTALASSFGTRATTARDGLASVLFNASTGVYDISDALTGTVGQDSNALAVLWGVADDSRASAMLDKLASSLATSSGHRAFSTDTGWGSVISPMVSGFEVGALFRAGRASDALALVRQGWRMMVENSTHACGTTWESMSDAGVPSGPDISLAHGWSAGPTAALSRHVLGARPLTAGWSRWLCKPMPGDLSWAAGQLPTPLGPVAVRWNLAPASGLRCAIAVTVPAGSECVLALTTAMQGSRVTVNGQTVSLDSALGTDADLDAASCRYLTLSGTGAFVIKVYA